MAAGIPDVPRIIGFRNILVHGYAAIDDATVWEIATVRLPALAAVAESLLPTDG